MIRIVLGAVFLLASVSVWFADAEPKPEDPPIAAISAVYAVPGLLLVHYGLRARRRAAIPAAAVAAGTDVKAKNKAWDRACAKGDLEGARTLLASGADVNAKDFADQTPLTSAIRTDGSVEMIRLLVDHGADVNAGPGHNPPLMCAALIGRADMARLLITQGANVNFATERGETPLIKAALMGHTDVVRALLEGGADVDAADEFGHTALYNSGNALLIGKKPDVVVELIEAGAALEGTAYPKKASLWASGPDTGSPYPWILAKDMRDKAGNTLLMIAAAQGKRRAVERLLPLADVAATNKAGETALALARASGHAEIESLLAGHSVGV